MTGSTDHHRSKLAIGRPTRWLHWTSALLVLLMFTIAWTFIELRPGPLAGRLVDLHRSLGLLVLALTALRLAWRLFHPLPPLPPGTAAWERWLARLVQAGLYVLLLAMPLIGWIASSAMGDTVAFFGLTVPDLVEFDEDLGERLFELHETVGYLILVLVAFHVAGSLRHYLIKRDDVLSRMLPLLRPRS